MIPFKKTAIPVIRLLTIHYHKHIKYQTNLSHQKSKTFCSKISYV